MHDETPALLGGHPVRAGGPPIWPLPDAGVLDALRAAYGNASWGQYLGPNVPALEAMLVEAHGVAHAATCASGTLAVEIYKPEKTDPQRPHTRDEVYVVVSGSGTFVNGGVRKPFGPGEVLFVPAFVEHRFEAFTDDFVTWVFFYGPEGGEAALDRASTIPS